MSRRKSVTFIQSIMIAAEDLDPIEFRVGIEAGMAIVQRRAPKAVAKKAAATRVAAAKAKVGNAGEDRRAAGQASERVGGEEANAAIERILQ